MSRKARTKDEDFGLKKSSGVDYSQVLDRHVDDARFERQRAIRAGTGPAPPVAKKADDSISSGKKPAAPSATMDAFMRMVTGKEERTIADRISDPNRPTWEQYKKENADKLDLFNVNEEKEMIEYRKKLDAAREKALARRGGGSKDKKKKKKRRAHSSSESESDSSDDDRRRSKKKSSSRKKKKSKKRRRSASSDSESDGSGASDSESDARSSRKKHKHKHKKKKSSSKSRERSPSPVRLSSFFNHSGSSDDDGDDDAN